MRNNKSVSNFLKQLKIEMEEYSKSRTRITVYAVILFLIYFLIVLIKQLIY